MPEFLHGDKTADFWVPSSIKLQHTNSCKGMEACAMSRNGQKWKTKHPNQIGGKYSTSKRGSKPAWKSTRGMHEALWWVFLWRNLSRTIDMRDIPPDTLLILPDFSATWGLKAAQLDNYSQDAHAVLAVFVVSHSQCDIEVEVPNGNGLTIRCTHVNNCYVW